MRAYCQRVAPSLWCSTLLSVGWRFDCENLLIMKCGLFRGATIRSEARTLLNASACQRFSPRRMMYCSLSVRWDRALGTPAVRRYLHGGLHGDQLRHKQCTSFSPSTFWRYLLRRSHFSRLFIPDDSQQRIYERVGGARTAFFRWSETHRSTCIWKYLKYKLLMAFLYMFWCWILRPASVAQRQSVGLGIERSLRNSLAPSGFSLRQGN